MRLGTGWAARWRAVLAFGLGACLVLLAGSPARADSRGGGFLVEAMPGGFELTVRNFDGNEDDWRVAEGQLARLWRSFDRRRPPAPRRQPRAGTLRWAADPLVLAGELWQLHEAGAGTEALRAVEGFWLLREAMRASLLGRGEYVARLGLYRDRYVAGPRAPGPGEDPRWDEARRMLYGLEVDRVLWVASGGRRGMEDVLRAVYGPGDDLWPALDRVSGALPFVRGALREMARGRRAIPLDAFADPDGDGLPNYWEQESGTSPALADSDADGQPDGADPQPLRPDARVTVNGGILSLTDPPLEDGDGVLVPVGPLLARWGAVVVWDPLGGQLRSALGSRQAALRLGSRGAWVNGSYLLLDRPVPGADSPPPSGGGEGVMAPPEWLAAALGAEVKWLPAERTVAVRSAGGDDGAAEPERRVAYLTFDDGPSSLTPQVLDILRRYWVPATFFVLGRNALGRPETIRRMVREGHAVGNHSYDHVYRSVYASPQAFVASAAKTAEVVEAITGLRMNLLRAPGGTAGHFNADYFEAVHRAGYVVFDWNVSAADAAFPRPSPAAIEGNIRAQVGGPSKPRRAVILMHDSLGHETTVGALAAVIEQLARQGYNFDVLRPGNPLGR